MDKLILTYNKFVKHSFYVCKHEVFVIKCTNHFINELVHASIQRVNETRLVSPLEKHEKPENMGDEAHLGILGVVEWKM